MRGVTATCRAGFSLLEVLLAGLTMAMVLLAVAPLFVRASADRLVGRRLGESGALAHRTAPHRRLGERWDPVA